MQSRNKREGYYRGVYYIYDLETRKMIKKHIRDKDIDYSLRRRFLGLWCTIKVK